MKTESTFNPCLESYIQAALWSSTDSNDQPLDKFFTKSDLADESLAKMQADWARFESENIETIDAAIQEGVECGPDFNEYERAAHDFWLTRNGHGAGFWDGDWPEPMAAKLTSAAKAFGSCELYVGDDGKIYIY